MLTLPIPKSPAIDPQLLFSAARTASWIIGSTTGQRRLTPREITEIAKKRAKSPSSWQKDYALFHTLIETLTWETFLSSTKEIFYIAGVNKYLEPIINYHPEMFR